VAAVIEEQGLGQLIGRRCGTLSGGELQRAHLARVTAQLRDEARSAAAWLMLDEPTANLDPAFQEQLLAQASRLATGGTGVLAVLHDLN
jgi:iron complex transport system ATP-binding protein